MSIADFGPQFLSKPWLTSSLQPGRHHAQHSQCRIQPDAAEEAGTLQRNQTPRLLVVVVWFLHPTMALLLVAEGRATLAPVVNARRTHLLQDQLSDLPPDLLPRLRDSHMQDPSLQFPLQQAPLAPLQLF